MTVGGSVTLTVDGGGGGGSLQTRVEEGLGSCHLAPRTLKPHSAGLTVLLGEALSRPRQGTPAGIS